MINLTEKSKHKLYITIKGGNGDFKIIELEIQIQLDSQNFWQICVYLTRVFSETNLSELFAEIFRELFAILKIDKPEITKRTIQLYDLRLLQIKNENHNSSKIITFLLGKIRKTIANTLSKDNTIITFINPKKHRSCQLYLPEFDPKEVHCRLATLPLAIKCDCGYGTVAGQSLLYWFGTAELHKKSNLLAECYNVVICPKCEIVLNVVAMENPSLAKTG